MVLKATVEKQRFKQSLRKVSPEAAVRKIDAPQKFRNRKSSLLESLFSFSLSFRQHGSFPVNIAKCFRTAFRFLEHLRCVSLIGCLLSIGHLPTFSS